MKKLVQSPPQELKVSPRSGLHLIVSLKGQRCIPTNLYPGELVQTVSQLMDLDIWERFKQETQNPTISS